MFLAIIGKRQYLWRAVDRDGTVLDILVASCRNAKAATRFPQAADGVAVSDRWSW